MSIHCDCGYQADSPQDLTDHITEIFTPEDDRGPDGLVHAQAAGDVPGTGGILTCLCGFTGVPGDLDEHLLRVFIPADRIGRDGRKHCARQLSATRAGG